MSLPSGQYKIISRENGLSLGRGQEDLSLKPKRIMTLSDDMPLKTDVVSPIFSFIYDSTDINLLCGDLLSLKSPKLMGERDYTASHVGIM